MVAVDGERSLHPAPRQPPSQSHARWTGWISRQAGYWLPGGVEAM